MTYVEMTDMSELIPAAPVPGLTLEPVDRRAPFIPGLLARIGDPHGWKSASRTEQEWAAWFAEYPDRTFWLHTSSQDHPRALANYHRRGFRTFKTEQVEHDWEDTH